MSQHTQKRPNSYNFLVSPIIERKKVFSHQRIKVKEIEQEVGEKRMKKKSKSQKEINYHIDIETNK